MRECFCAIAEIWTWAHALAQQQPRPVLPEQVLRELAQSMDNECIADVDFRAQARTLLFLASQRSGRQFWQKRYAVP